MSDIHPIMQASIERFIETSRTAMLPPSDLPQLAAKLDDERDPIAELSYARYFAMVDTLRAAYKFIDGADEDSAIMRSQIERALAGVGEQVGQAV